MEILPASEPAAPRKQPALEEDDVSEEEVLQAIANAERRRAIDWLNAKIQKGVDSAARGKLVSEEESSAELEAIITAAERKRNGA